MSVKREQSPGSAASEVQAKKQKAEKLDIVGDFVFNSLV